MASTMFTCVVLFTFLVVANSKMNCKPGTGYNPDREDLYQTLKPSSKKSTRLNIPTAVCILKKKRGRFSTRTLSRRKLALVTIRVFATTCVYRANEINTAMVAIQSVSTAQETNLTPYLDRP